MTPEETVTRFEAADFDFGLFLDYKYIYQLREMYSATRPQHEPPRPFILMALAAEVRAGRLERPTQWRYFARETTALRTNEDSLTDDLNMAVVLNCVPAADLLRPRPRTAS